MLFNWKMLNIWYFLLLYYTRTPYGVRSTCTVGTGTYVRSYEYWGNSFWFDGWHLYWKLYGKFIYINLFLTVYLDSFIYCTNTYGDNYVYTVKYINFSHCHGKAQEPWRSCWRTCLYRQQESSKQLIPDNTVWCFILQRETKKRKGKERKGEVAREEGEKKRRTTARRRPINKGRPCKMKPIGCHGTLVFAEVCDDIMSICVSYCLCIGLWHRAGPVNDHNYRCNLLQSNKLPHKSTTKSFPFP